MEQAQLRMIASSIGRRAPVFMSEDTEREPSVMIKRLVFMGLVGHHISFLSCYQIVIPRSLSQIGSNNLLMARFNEFADIIASSIISRGRQAR